MRTQCFFGWLATLLASSCIAPTGMPSSERPNVVMIYADDMGWGDLGTQGAQGFRTPHLDRLAAQGTRFRSAYVPIPVCTPSRAALLTGCHPMRLGFGYRVLFPYSNEGLHPDEVTIAETLRAAGYRTACFGKWHLGHHRKFLPTRQGFDRFFGIPYSNDMDGYLYRRQKFQAPPLPLYEGEYLVESAPNQDLFTRRFTTMAIQWLREHKDRPFFLYLAHPMPHRPIHASGAARRTSNLGLYGDVIQEVDDSVGRILAALDDEGLTHNTIVVFSSDNGPWRQASSGGLRGKKATTWEGGVRVPFLVRWPKRIPAGRVSDVPISVLDFKPTIEAIVGIGRGPNPMDGRDIRAEWIGRGAPSLERRVLAFYRNNRLQALRQGRFKLHVHVPNSKDPGRPRLFDLSVDPWEKNDIAIDHPTVVAALTAHAEAIRLDLGDAVTSTRGHGLRPVGSLR